jgi:hypothetical protein
MYLIHFLAVVLTTDSALSTKIRADIKAYEQSDLFADVCLITKIRTRLGRGMLCSKSTCIVSHVCIQPVYAAKMQALRELLQYQQARDGSGKLERR